MMIEGGISQVVCAASNCEYIQTNEPCVFTHNVCVMGNNIEAFKLHECGTFLTYYVVFF